jgi:hypothetical protein
LVNRRGKGSGLCGRGQGLSYPAAPALDLRDHDDFGSIPSKIMNVIDSKSLERDAGGKPVSTFLVPL